MFSISLFVYFEFAQESEKTNNANQKFKLPSKLKAKQNKLPLNSVMEWAMWDVESWGSLGGEGEEGEES